MSSWHMVSGNPRRKVVHYRYGVKDTSPKHWYSKRAGWFGHMVLASCLMMFGVFSVQVRDMALQFAGAPLYNLASEIRKSEQVKRLEGGPEAAKNIIELQPLVADWVKANKGVQWGIIIKNISGPEIEASVQPNASFESRAVYKTYLAAALHDQYPKRKLYTTVKVGKRSVTIASCIERMLKEDDRACTEALSYALNLDRAYAFLKGAGVTRTILSPTSQSAQTTPTDTATFFTALDNALLEANAKKQLLKQLSSQPERQALTVACPGCTTTGVADFGLGRLESAGIVHYASGSYVYIVYATGGTEDQSIKLSGKVQQKIVEVTTGNIKP